MTLAATNVLCFDQIGDAFGAWICRFSVKELMADFGVAEQTAKKWRTGKLPEPRHMVAMVERWNQPFLESIFAPALRRTELDLIGQMESVEVQISLMRERVTNEARRRDGLRLAAGAAGARADGGIGGTAVVGDPAERLGGGAAPGRGALAALSAGAIGAIGGMILLLAALHGPLSDLLDDGGFSGRATRSVRVVRVVRAGRTGRNV